MYILANLKFLLTTKKVRNVCFTKHKLKKSSYMLKAM